MLLFILRNTESVFVHNASALTPDFSQNEDKRAISQYMGKQSNWCYLFENVTRNIFL